MLKTKFKSIAALFVLIFAVTLFTGCNKEEVIQFSSIKVDIQMATDYVDIPLANIMVQIHNVNDNFRDSLPTDFFGSVTFNNLPPGIYNVTASKHLNASQAYNATGFNQEVTLNAISNNVSPLPGQQATVSLTMDGRPAGSLLIKQFYYGGSRVPTAPLILFKDQFVEIYNNSDNVIYADGLYLATVWTRPVEGTATQKPPTLPVNEFVYTQQLLKVPGNGTQYPIQPYTSFVIAANGIDFTEGGRYATGTVNNSRAKFEINENPLVLSRGIAINPILNSPDNPDIPDMLIEYFWMTSFFYFYPDGCSIALLRMDATPTVTIVDPDYQAYPALKLPVSAIIDGVDFLGNAQAGAFKKLPITVDAGFNFIPGGSRGTAKSMMRKVVRTVNGKDVLMDTNNSANDFEVIDVRQY